GRPRYPAGRSRLPDHRLPGCQPTSELARRPGDPPPGVPELPAERGGNGQFGAVALQWARAQAGNHRTDMTLLKDIRLYTTQPHACSYLPGQRARTLFIDPEFPVDKAHNSRLSELGFRRSGAHVYRPNCGSCQQCMSCRVVVRLFQPNRRFQRILRRNEDIDVRPVEDISGDEYYLLYSHYINVRHGDGDMYPPSREQYQSFLQIGRASCRERVYMSRVC